MTELNSVNALKLDLHIHSCYSEDASGTPKEIIKVLQKKGFNGLSITDHNTVKGSLEALKVKPKDFIVIPGVEVSTADGHILALGVKKDIKRNLPVVETVEHIVDAGGVPVVPHLFRSMSGIKKSKLELVKDMVPAIEVFNSCSLAKTNIKVSRVAKEFKLGGTGGSDTHEPAYAGYGYTIFECSDTDVDTLLSVLERKQTWGDGTTIPLQIRKERMLKSIKQFFQRGFKRI